MTLYYLDASAWVKRYLREAGSKWVHRLFKQEKLLCCATLGLIEVVATLARKRHAGEIGVPLWDSAGRFLIADWDRFCHVELSAPVLETALRVVEATALRGADAVHLASALVLHRRLETSAEELCMVASDRELLEAARQFGLQVADPEVE